MKDRSEDRSREIASHAMSMRSSLLLRKASGKTRRTFPSEITRLDGFPPYSVFEFASPPVRRGSTSRAATEARGNKYISEDNGIFRKCIAREGS